MNILLVSFDTREEKLLKKKLAKWGLNIVLCENENRIASLLKNTAQIDIAILGRKNPDLGQLIQKIQDHISWHTISFSPV